MMMKTYTFARIQHGFWGQTQLDKRINVKAENETMAQMKINARADAFKRLRNGDSLSWSLVDINS